MKREGGQLVNTEGQINYSQVQSICVQLLTILFMFQVRRQIFGLLVGLKR